MRLVFSAVARSDIAEIIAYISVDNPAAALRQRQLVEAAARRLLDFPALGTSAGERYRRLQVTGTPFWLLYRPQGDAIVILRIWHGARQWPPSA